MLLDKLHSKKFFTEKDLKITIIDSGDSDNWELISDISKKFNDRDFTVEVISDLENNYVGNSADILLSFTDKYDLDNMIARGDIIKVIVSINGLKTDGYDISVSLNEDKIGDIPNISIENDFAAEFLDKLEKIIIDGYEF